MIRKGLRPMLPVLIAVATLIVSCSDEKKNLPLGPDTSLNMPPVPRPEIPLQFNFMSNDSIARIAQGLTTTELAKASETARLGSVYLDPLEDARWGEKDGVCRKWVYPWAGCATTYWLCELDGTYLFALTAAGSCGDNFHIGDIMYAGTMSGSGNSGTGQIYGYLANTPERSWTWTTVGEATWTFYDGDLESGQITEILISSENPDRSRDLGLELPEVAKWSAHVSGDLAQGWMRVYNWDIFTLTFRLDTEIHWDHGTGSHVGYNADGTPAYEREW